MLGSQTSSSSSTSLLSNRNENFKQLFPEKFREISLIARKVFLAGEFFHLMITSQCELIEFKGGEVVNSLSLQSHFLDEEVKIVKAEDVECEAMIGSDFVVLAVKIHSKLFGIERRPSQFKVLKVLTQVKSVRLAVDENTDEVSFAVTFNDNQLLPTNFLDDELEKFWRKKKSTPVFDNIFECVSHKTAAAQDQLENLEREIKESSMKLQGEVPATMLQDVNL